MNSQSAQDSSENMPFDVEEVLSKLSNGEKASLLSGELHSGPLFHLLLITCSQLIVNSSRVEHLLTAC